MVGCGCNSCRIPWQSGTCYFGSDFGWAIFWPIQDICVVAEPLCDRREGLWPAVKWLHGQRAQLFWRLCYFAAPSDVVVHGDVTTTKVRCEHDGGLAHRGPCDDRGRTGRRGRRRRRSPRDVATAAMVARGAPPPPSPATAPAPARRVAATFPTSYRDNAPITVGTAAVRAKALVMTRLGVTREGGEAPLPLPPRKPRPYPIPTSPSPPHSERTAGTAFPSFPGR